MIVYRKDKNFNQTLDKLQKQYFKEESVATIYATNSVLANAIKRCRPGIKYVDVHAVGATLYFDTKAFRPFHTVLRIKK